VTFEVTGGAGSVAPAKVVTDAKGIAAVGSWTLGQDLGNNVLTAHALHLAPVLFTALANAPFFASIVVSGLYHTCAIAQDGDTYCWGLNDRHQVSYDPRGAIQIPQRIPFAHRFVSLATGGFHNCAISDEVPSQAYCWGENGSGQTGTGISERIVTAPAQVPVPGGLTMVVTGLVHSCGLNPAGEAFCWGAGRLGQLGDGAITDHSRPARVSATLRFTSLAAGTNHTCGLTIDGQTYCWGYNDHNQLGVATAATCAGDGSYYPGYNVPSYVPCATTPQLVPTARFVAISAGYGTCGLTAGGEVDCAGFNSGMVPVSQELRFARLAPDGRCGFGVDGVAYCWSTTDGLLNAPVVSETGSTPRSIAHGSEHTCGVLGSDGSVVCLGHNQYGQLGNGTTIASNVPLPVARPANP
jgi:alpha-tubulin suppressor-like RCC1 family protein